MFAIFGGAGDLIWRSLLPASFDPSLDHSTPSHFSIIAVDRVDLNEAVPAGIFPKGSKCSPVFTVRQIVASGEVMRNQTDAQNPFREKR